MTMFLLHPRPTKQNLRSINPMLMYDTSRLFIPLPLDHIHNHLPTFLRSARSSRIQIRTPVPRTQRPNLHRRRSVFSTHLLMVTYHDHVQRRLAAIIRRQHNVIPGRAHIRRKRQRPHELVTKTTRGILALAQRGQHRLQDRRGANHCWFRRTGRSASGRTTLSLATSL